MRPLVGPCGKSQRDLQLAPRCGSELTPLQRPPHRALTLYDATQSQDVDGCVRLAPIVVHTAQARRLVVPGPHHSDAAQIDVAVEPDDLISRIKERIEEMEGASSTSELDADDAGIPPAQQRLIFNGKQMCARFVCSSIGSPRRADEKSVKQANIEPGSTIHLVLALRGGC